MPEFDAELYLRTRGERLLSGPREGRGWGLPLGDPASALVAIGAISYEAAHTVLDEYSLAEALRAEHGLHQRASFHAHTRAHDTAAKPFAPARVVPCVAMIELASGGTLNVHRALLGPGETRIAATWRPGLAARGPRRGAAMVRLGGPMQPPTPMVADDRGTQHQAHFAGSGSAEVWTGLLELSRPLHPDTRWLEIDGRRLELTGEADRSTVTTEPLTETFAAARYLWNLLETRSAFRGPEHDLEHVIDALLAADAIAADDPVLTEVRAVDARLVQGSIPPGPGARLPEPWRSLATRSERRDGPVGTLTLDAVTPVFDGFAVRVEALSSQADSWSLAVDVSPGVGFPHHPASGAHLRPRTLGWWAVDNRGEHHLGAIHDRHGSDQAATQTIVFPAPLHPDARALTIMPTATRERALITVELPWR